MERAYIQPLNEKGEDIGSKVKVLFNPNQYTIEKQNQFQSTMLPGLSVPPTHFVSGSGRTLNFDLFFDTYQDKEDVRNHTNQIMGLLEINEKLKAPPICKFVWGKQQEFKGVVEKATQRFTMFLESGIPVRAVMNVSLREYKSISEQLNKAPESTGNRSKKITVVSGDTLWAIAEREYGAPQKWRKIADANSIDNPRTLKPGSVITIPPLE